MSRPQKQTAMTPPWTSRPTTSPKWKVLIRMGADSSTPNLAAASCGELLAEDLDSQANIESRRTEALAG